MIGTCQLFQAGGLCLGFLLHVPFKICQVQTIHLCKRRGVTLVPLSNCKVTDDRHWVTLKAVRQRTYMSGQRYFMITCIDIQIGLLTRSWQRNVYISVNHTWFIPKSEYSRYHYLSHLYLTSKSFKLFLLNILQASCCIILTKTHNFCSVNIRNLTCEIPVLLIYLSASVIYKFDLLVCFSKNLWKVGSRSGEWYFLCMSIAKN